MNQREKIEAIRKGPEAILPIIGEDFSRIDNADSMGYTLLYLATEEGNRDVVQFLLDHGANTNKVPYLRDKTTLLHLAARRGHEDIVRIFTARKGVDRVDINRRDGAGQTALHLASRGGHDNVVNFLIELGAQVFISDKQGNSMLHSATESGNKNLVILFLRLGFNVNIQNRSKSTPLHLAVTEDYEDCVKLLLESGARIDIKDDHGNSAIHCAACFANKDILNLILSNELDINERNVYEMTALQIALHFGHDEIVKSLIKHGALLYAKDRNGNSLVHSAVNGRNKDILKLLINRGCDVNVKNESKEMPLHIAARNSLNDIVKILIEEGAQIDTKDEFGTPLMCACGRNNVETAKILLKANSNVEAINALTGNTTLAHVVSNNDSIAIVKLLLQYGANVNVSVIYGCNECKPLLFHHVCRVPPIPVVTDDWLGKLCGEGEYLELFLDYGVDIQKTSRVNGDEFSIFALALHKKYEVAIQLLLDYGGTMHINPNNAYIDKILRFGFVYKVGKHIKLLVRHIVKVQSQNLPISESILNAIVDSSDAKACKIQCEREIEKMKSDNSEVPFWKILTSNHLCLADFARNEEIIRVFQSDECKVNFPIYSSVLKNQMRRGIWRKILLDKVQYFFKALGETGDNELPILPKLCVDKIFSYFSNRDFRNLIRVCDPHNDFDLDLCDIELSNVKV